MPEGRGTARGARQASEHNPNAQSPDNESTHANKDGIPFSAIEVLREKRIYVRRSASWKPASGGTITGTATCSRDRKLGAEGWLKSGLLQTVVMELHHHLAALGPNMTLDLLPPPRSSRLRPLTCGFHADEHSCRRPKGRLARSHVVTVGWFVAVFGLGAQSITPSEALGQRSASDAVSFVSLRFGTDCGDRRNRQVFLSSRHPQVDIMATVRWRVANGPISERAFRIAAGAEQQIGCAWDGAIVAARFLGTPGDGGENAASFATIALAGGCGDGRNYRMVVTNSHPTRALVITVRSRVWNGVERSNQLRLGPGSRQQIGCAEQARITAVRFA